MAAKTCARCKETKDELDYFKVCGGKSLRTICKECSKFHRRTYTTKNRARLTAQVKEKNNRFKREGVELLGNKCQRCNILFHMSAMDFHHVGAKDGRQIAAKGWSNFLKEIDKCVLICSNCHKYIHNEDKTFTNDIKAKLLLNEITLDEAKLLTLTHMKDTYVNP